jgi:hypothetical protein
MSVGHIFGMKDFPKITKKLFKSIIKQRWTFILGFVINLLKPIVYLY